MLEKAQVREGEAPAEPDASTNSTTAHREPRGIGI